MTSRADLRKPQVLAALPGTVLVLVYMFYPTWRIFSGAEEGQNMGLLGVVQTLVTYCVIELWFRLLAPTKVLPRMRRRMQRIALLALAATSLVIAKAYFVKTLTQDDDPLHLKLIIIALSLTAFISVCLQQFYTLVRKKS